MSRIGLCAIPVSNLDASVAFWTRTVGLILVADEAASDGARRVQLAIPGADTGLALIAEPGSEQGGRSGKLHASFECCDVQAAYRTLTARGVEFVEPPRRDGQATHAKFVDPDGNVFSLSSRNR